MVRVRKSPNMMSTTGRRPVIAAPTPIPVKPASEMGVSSTRSAPNSSTSPESTLKGVPASATSSPKMQTRESRRISSASASRTACAKVSSRSGIDVLADLVGAGVRRVDREFYRCFDFFAGFGRDLVESGLAGESESQKRFGVQFDGISFGLPKLLFLLGPVVFAVDITYMMAAVAIRIRLEKRRALARASSLYEPSCDFVHRANILAIDGRRLDAEGGGAAEDRSRGRLGKMRVLVIQIVFADVDDGQLPQLRQVHDFVERS